MSVCILLGQQSLDTIFGNLKIVFCWDKNYFLLEWKLPSAGMKILVTAQYKIYVGQFCTLPLQFENSICPKQKLHFASKIAIFKIQNSILSQKCSLFKMKLAFMVENQVWAKWKWQFLLKLMICQNENYFFPEISNFKKQK